MFQVAYGVGYEFVLYCHSSIGYQQLPGQSIADLKVLEADGGAGGGAKEVILVIIYRYYHQKHWQR